MKNNDNLTKKSPSAPDYDPDLWNSQVSDQALLDFSKDNRRAVLHVLARDKYDKIPEIRDLDMVGHDLDRSPLYRTQDFLVSFNKAIETLPTHKDVAQYFGIELQTVNQLAPNAKKLYLAQGFQEYANCYTYAMNDMDRYSLGGDRPGQRADHFFNSSSFSDFKAYKQQLLEAVEADGAIIAGSNAPPLEGYYRVGVYARPPSTEGKTGDNSLMDYHFVRENSDGTWSQKQGFNPVTGRPGLVTNKDDHGEIITDPQKATLGRYEFVSFVYVPEGGLDVGHHFEPKTKPNSLDTPMLPEEDWKRKSSAPYPETSLRNSLQRP